ncbi:MAG TPA: hypothetical protein EYH09_01150 [Candidatus Nanopusillus sp.]|nr:hypothetical protein [Candidatus Nanopusillus sp.]HIP90120.1 hypothetical protein [Candidatus Nanopusillus sp.]
MKARFFFEALGSPKDFITQFLNKLLEDIKQFEGLEITNYKIEEPIEREIEVNGKKIKMWSSFLELEGSPKDFQSLLDFILMFSPSHIEIEGIKKIEFTKDELNNMLNAISARILQLTTVINDLNAKNQLLLHHLEKVAPRLAQQFKSKPEFKRKQ